MNLIEMILTKATEDTHFKPFPNNRRQCLKTSVIVVDEIPKRYLCKKVCDLDFWNEISGFMQTTTSAIVSLTQQMAESKFLTM